MVHWECCQVRNYPNRNYAKLDSISPPQFGRSSAANTALSENLSKHIRNRKSKHNQQEKIYLSTTNKEKIYSSTSAIENLNTTNKRKSISVQPTKRKFIRAQQTREYIS